MRHLLLTMLLVLSVSAAKAVERWETLPPTPAPIAADSSGNIEANGISIRYAMYGTGSPVILLHGGLANADYWGHQIEALKVRHTVIVMDSRGHGRTTRDGRPYGYDIMADDVVALMDALKVLKADVVGWSDGGILGLDLAIRHKDRVGKIFVFAANTVPSGVKDEVEKNPIFAAFIARARQEYGTYSATPKEYDAFVEVGPARRVPSGLRAFDEFSWRMLAAGLPLFRVTLHVSTLHPQYLGATFVWFRSTGQTSFRLIAHELADRIRHEDNPVARVVVGGVRRRIVPDAVLDFRCSANLQTSRASTKAPRL